MKILSFILMLWSDFMEWVWPTRWHILMVHIPFHQLNYLPWIVAQHLVPVTNVRDTYHIFGDGPPSQELIDAIGPAIARNVFINMEVSGQESYVWPLFRETARQYFRCPLGQEYKFIFRADDGTVGNIGVYR